MSTFTEAELKTIAWLCEAQEYNQQDESEDCEDCKLVIAVHAKVNELLNN